MNQQTIENKIEEENDMTFGSVFKSLIPSVIVGTAAAAGCQELASEYTSNPEAITLVGMAGQYLGGYGTYFPVHLYNNRERLVENGKIKWKDYIKDISSIMVSDRVGNKVWACTYGLANEGAIRFGASPMLAGATSGVTSGLVYSAFTGAVAPRINTLIDKTKKLVGKIRNKRN